MRINAAFSEYLSNLGVTLVFLIFPAITLRYWYFPVVFRKARPNFSRYQTYDTRWLQPFDQAVTEDLRREIDFLLCFDNAKHALNNMLDWPPQSIDLFIRLVHQNNGELSAGKRQSQFNWLTDEEVARSEACVRQAFSTPSAFRQPPIF